MISLNLKLCKPDPFSIRRGPFHLGKELPMNAEKDLRSRLQLSLRKLMHCQTNKRGYVRFPEENLVDGISLKHFEADLRDGDGNELRMKFCAAHSSAALAVNCFAWFNQSDRKPLLSLLGKNGANTLRFEKKLPIFHGGRPPNLDVWIERGDEVIGIESKFTEYLVKKKPGFSKAYDRLRPPANSESCWWSVYEQAKRGKPRYLDIAQLVKHYFGLWRYKRSENAAKSVNFLFMFWEPQNWQDLDVCQHHRQECAELAQATKESVIPFNWLSYPNLWQEWLKSPVLAQHAQDLIRRYGVQVK